MNWQHRHATINGIHMHYVEQGEGMPVILCHGFPHLWFSWHRQISALAGAGYRVIAPDMRGMGQTEAPPEVEAYDIEHITGDLLGLLDHIGEERAIFVDLRQVRMIPGAGHMVQLEASDEVNAILLDYLADIQQCS